MPWGGGTGPRGLGPMTGRRAGYCAGFGTPGFMNPIPQAGLGFGAGYRAWPAWPRYGAGYGAAWPGYGATWPGYGAGYGAAWPGYGAGYGAAWPGYGAGYGWIPPFGAGACHFLFGKPPGPWHRWGYW